VRPRALLLLAALLLVPARRVQASDALPNLRAYAPFGIEIGSTDRYYPDGTGAIRFGVRVGNVGDVPLDITGVPIPGSHAVVAQQCLGWVEAACIDYGQLGTYTWHAQHTSHWHMPELFAFELRSLQPDRSPDPSSTGLVAVGSRSHVCVVDSEQLVLAEATPTPYTVCSSVHQGLSSFWAFTVQPHADEQFIALDAVQDGDYALVVVVNPTRRVLESSSSDNVAFRRIRISGDGTLVGVLP